MATHSQFSAALLRGEIDRTHTEADLRPLVHGYLVILFDADAYRPSEGPKACSGSNPEQVGGGLPSISPCHVARGMELKKGGGPNPSEADTLTLFEYPHDYPIGARSFNIPGLGRAGLLCGHRRMSHFSSDGKAARYDPLKCRRIECPECWKDWARRAVFELALRVEAYSRSVGKRPCSCVFSVSPERVEAGAWSWDRVGQSLFRRGYRRSRSHGVDGGVVVFHPYRIKPFWKHRFRRSGEHREVGMWKLIRERVQRGERLGEFVKLGPHSHAIVFGDPQAHSCDDFVLAFRDDDNGVPKKLETSKDVVGFLFYLATHTGVLNHLRKYRRGVQRRKTHTIRAFGCARARAIELLPPAEYEALAKEIAELLGMEWVDGELRYPASIKDFDTSDAGIEWIPLHELGGYLSNEAWLTSLSYFQVKFWLGVLRFMVRIGRPPDIGDVAPPGDVLVFEAKPLDEKSENDQV